MTVTIGRRELLAALGGAAAAWPLAARAQQPAMPVVGYIGGGSQGSDVYRVTPFLRGLKEVGFVGDQNVAIEYRWAEHRYDRFLGLAIDVVQRGVAVIVTDSGINAALAAKAATSTIPIVFEVGVDPVEAGLVASLNRPGRNATGVTSLNVEIGQKQVELVRELVPTANVIALLINPANPNAENLSKGANAAARHFGLQPHIAHASTERDFTAVFGALEQLRAKALVIGVDPFFASRSAELAELAVRHAIPAISPYRAFTAAGGLASYGGNLADAYRLVGVYTGRIIKGEKPADLPVQRVTSVQLVINLKAAKALGLEVPPTLLARADEVIE